MHLFETIQSVNVDASVVGGRAFGVIEVRDGQLRQISFRPWPLIVSMWRVWSDIYLRPTRTPDDACWLYFDQHMRMPSYLLLKYIVSAPGTSFRTFRAATLVLDEVARIKQSDAILCEATNSRISERLLVRWGWERHVPGSRRRHYIKRFYGEYPQSTLGNSHLAETFHVKRPNANAAAFR